MQYGTLAAHEPASFCNTQNYWHMSKVVSATWNMKNAVSATSNVIDTCKKYFWQHGTLAAQR